MNGELPLTAEAAVLGGWAGLGWGAILPPYGCFKLTDFPPAGTRGLSDEVLAAPG